MICDVWRGWIVGWVAWRCLALGPGTAGADFQPVRIGTLEVQIQFTCSGDSSTSIQDASGSASASDAYSYQLTSRATYAVLLKGTNASSGDLLQASSSLVVDGGGSATISGDNGSYTTAWKYRAPSGFDPTQPYAYASYYSPSGSASAGTGARPGAVIDPPDASLATDGLAAAREAADGVGTGFLFEVPRTVEAWFRSGTHVTNVTHSSEFISSSSRGNARCSVELRFQPDSLPRWQAILEVDPPLVTTHSPAYEQWVPRGSLEADSDRPGNALPVRVHLEPLEGELGVPPKAKYRFYLSDVSREPGVLMNHPARAARGCATTPEGPFDLRLLPAEGLVVAGDGQSAETETSQKEAGIGVGSYDFGAYGTLKVVALTDDGQTLVAHRKGAPDDTVLGIPRDQNQNHVADAWEKEVGVFDRNLAPEWDGVEEPAGQAYQGDGISLYERYRGFLVLNGVGKEVYERLDPQRKHVFIWNPDRMVQQVFTAPEGLPESYMAAAECEVRYLGASGWSGPGSYAEGKRVVNFNCSGDKHAVDQHALDIRLVTSSAPSIPKEVQDLRASLGLEPLEPLSSDIEGRAYRDASAPEMMRAQWRPAAAFRTEIYTAAVGQYVLDTLTYHSTAACPGCSEEDLTAEKTAYMVSHRAEAARKYTIELSATITHEMGHCTGVTHHDPKKDSATDNTLKNCVMRYYKPEEFPADTGDRFELAARGNNPDSFCRRVHNCWGKLKLTDNPKAEPGGAGSQALRPGLLATRGGRGLAGGTGAGFIPPIPVPEPTAYELSTDLVWEEWVEGDPLRLQVRLHGLNDRVVAEWTTGLRMRLLRLIPDGTAEEVMGPGDWSAFLRTDCFDTTVLAVPNVTRISEWMVPSDRVKLVEGHYRLEVAWHGVGLAPAEGLPPSGRVELPAIPMKVVAPVTPALAATHQRHLAWERWSNRDWNGAMASVREAERLDPGRRDPEAVDSRMIGASSALRLRDALGALQLLTMDARNDDPQDDHLASVASDAFDQLAPRLQVTPVGPGSAPGSVRLRIGAFPGGTYVVQRSPDLRVWTSLSTNTPAGGEYVVEDAEPSGQQFYRVTWAR